MTYNLGPNSLIKSLSIVSTLAENPALLAFLLKQMLQRYKHIDFMTQWQPRKSLLMLFLNVLVIVFCPYPVEDHNPY